MSTKNLKVDILYAALILHPKELKTKENCLQKSSYNILAVSDQKIPVNRMIWAFSIKRFEPSINHFWENAQKGTFSSHFSVGSFKNKRRKVINYPFSKITIG